MSARTRNAYRNALVSFCNWCVDTDRLGAALTGANKPKTFMSVGHDEYWSGGQRANVEAARAAGVNLAFVSGNEIFWKTRYESSIDGTGVNVGVLSDSRSLGEAVLIIPLAVLVGGIIWTYAAWRGGRAGGEPSP